jgi:ATP-binding cassette subfamily B protein
LYVPKLAARVIDQSGTHLFQTLMIVAILSFLIAVTQIYSSTYFSEKVALDLRKRLITKVSGQTFGYISNSTPGRLLTIITSDVDAVKGVISQGLVALLGALVTLFGAAIFLLYINLHLALLTLAVIPFLVLAIALIFGALSKLFVAGQENVEKINAVINESIIGAAVVRVLDSRKLEVKKFDAVNTQSRAIGLKVVAQISALIPIITLLANLSVMIIIWFGGKLVVGGGLTVGNFSAFLSYSALFIWPLFVLSFVGTMISRGSVSLKRIRAVLDAPVEEETGKLKGEVKGDIEFKDVTLQYADEGGAMRSVLKNISFKIASGTRNAIVGPTAAGKTQLFYLLAGLMKPTSGEILIDGKPISLYDPHTLFSQIGLVFQDSIMFNTTFKDNIALSGETDKSIMNKAIETAELHDLVESLPHGLETLVSERGTSLSGGQKQRLMLARALAVDPKILLLDDFTARVDQATENSILQNVAKNYPHVTLVSITQKVEPIASYDQIIVLMEGELVATGKHAELLQNSFEYKQIYESQKTTESAHH